MVVVRYCRVRPLVFATRSMDWVAREHAKLALVYLIRVGLGFRVDLDLQTRDIVTTQIHTNLTHAISKCMGCGVSKKMF